MTREKKRFLIIHDYGSAGCAWFHYAYSREQLEKKYASPHNCDEIVDAAEVDKHPYVRYLADAGRAITAYDDDMPGKRFSEDIVSGERTEIPYLPVNDNPAR